MSEELTPGGFFGLCYTTATSWDQPYDEVVGGTPLEEMEWEDGLEAPLRPALRSRGERDRERDEESLPDVEALWERQGTPEVFKQDVFARADADIRQYRSRKKEQD